MARIAISLNANYDAYVQQYTSHNGFGSCGESNNTTTYTLYNSSEELDLDFYQAVDKDTNIGTSYNEFIGLDFLYIPSLKNYIITDAALSMTAFAYLGSSYVTLCYLINKISGLTAIDTYTTIQYGIYYNPIGTYSSTPITLPKSIVDRINHRINYGGCISFGLSLANPASGDYMQFRSSEYTADPSLCPKLILYGVPREAIRRTM